jgi:hypothetical protein
MDLAFDDMYGGYQAWIEDGAIFLIFKVLQQLILQKCILPG